MMHRLGRANGRWGSSSETEGHKPLGKKHENLIFSRPAKLPQSACHVRLGNVGVFAETPFVEERTEPTTAGGWFPFLPRSLRCPPSLWFLCCKGIGDAYFWTGQIFCRSGPSR